MENRSKSPNSQLPENVFFVLHKQLFPIKKETTKIGRHPKNDLIINDSLVSRWHAEVRFEDGDFALYDLDAKYGTRVNNDRVERCVLKSGDTISLATTPLLFIDRSEQIIDYAQNTTGMVEKK
jgi:pSer/pThr/pTyr-binding forkhead associated (FHA) protein